MSYRGLTVLAIIPARGGSKGIPRKNLRRIAGLSLVGHAARLAGSLDWLDRAVISTDDEEIAGEGRPFGVAAPFLRPPALASDGAKSVDMWQHAWQASESFYNERYDVSILLEPTSPLRKIEDIAATLDALLDSKGDAAATVSRAPAHFTPQKCLTVDEHNLIGFYHQQGARHSLRQSIPDYYYRNGICYALHRETLLVKGVIIEHNCQAVIIERPVVNIDDLHELEYAAFLYERYYANLF